MKDNDQIAAEALAQFEKAVETDGLPLDTFERSQFLEAVKSAIEKAVNQAMTCVDMDSQSWGGIKLEWRPEEGRIYAYSDSGDFLFSGSPAYAVWSCIRKSRAAHASEPEVRMIRTVSGMMPDIRKPAHASEPWTVENIKDAWIVRIGTLRIVTSKANAIALRDAHNATLSQRPTPVTKRLAEFVRRCGDHMICGTNIADTPLPTMDEWKEILAIADAAVSGRHE